MAAHGMTRKVVSFDRARYDRAARGQQVYRDWRAGKVIPYRITQALDLHGHEGPKVDEACGVEEPAVDMWEAGTLYPTWEQLNALALICPQVTLPYFVLPLTESLPLQTTLRFHRLGSQKADWRQPPPVRCFTPEAIAATVRSVGS